MPVANRPGPVRRALIAAAMIGLASSFAFPAASAPPKASSASKVYEITWDDLWPEGEDEKLEELFEAYLKATNRSIDDIAEGSTADSMVQIGTFNTVAGLNGKHVRLPGYIVPLDFSAKKQHTTFLLVPYFGACIHTPPPPPNQIVHVTARPAATIENVWAPVWIEGVISTTRQDSDLGDAAYTMTMTRIEPYSR